MKGASSLVLWPLPATFCCHKHKWRKGRSAVKRTLQVSWQLAQLQRPRERLFLFSKVSRSTLGPIQPPVQWASVGTPSPHTHTHTHAVQASSIRSWPRTSTHLLPPYATLLPFAAITWGSFEQKALRATQMTERDFNLTIWSCPAPYRASTHEAISVCTKLYVWKPSRGFAAAERRTAVPRFASRHGQDSCCFSDTWWVHEAWGFSLEIKRPGCWS